MPTPRKSAPSAKSPAARAPAAKSAPSAPVAELSHPLPEPGVEPVEVAEALVEQFDGFGDFVRRSGELGLEQARASLDRVKEAAGQAAGDLEAVLTAASAGATELNLKALDAAQASADAAFDFARSLASARSLAEIVELQTAHMRQQMEAANAQMRAYADLARKVSADTLTPLGQTLEKTFGRAA